MRLAKIYLGKSCHESTCIIMGIILYTSDNILHIVHNIFHIAHKIFHIIWSYARRSWNHRLNIKTSQKDVPTYETLTREPFLANTETASFIHMYFISFIHKLLNISHT